jgi:hypothetical protein
MLIIKIKPLPEVQAYLGSKSKYLVRTPGMDQALGIQLIRKLILNQNTVLINRNIKCRGF